ATSHIVALRFLSQYEVVRKHDNEGLAKPVKKNLDAEELVQMLKKKYRIKETGSLPPNETGIVTWCGHMIKAFSRKQTVPALSSCEAELIAAVDLAKEALSVKFEKYELKTRYNLLVDSINRAILLGD
ncbi:unnamed protein product, partial [Effrenium voratum]